MPYLGNEPATAYTSTTKDTFSGDASTTDFTMSKSANVNAVRVVVENVVQNPTVAYTCSGTTISFTSAPPTGTNNIYVVHLGPPAATVAPPTTINNATTFTGGVTLKNETAEDTDGGRESIVTFQGTQSGNEITTLAQIQASHDGTSDDEAGDLIIKVNDGNDGASPSEAMRINSLGNVGIGTANIDVSTQAGGSGYKALQIESDEGGQLNFDHNDAGTGSTLGQINFQRAGEVLAEIEGVTDGATDNGRIAFRVQPDGGALGEVMRIDHTGNVMIGHTSQDSPVDNGGAGVTLRTQGVMLIGGTGTSIYANREDSDGEVMQFRKDGSSFGGIGLSGGNNMYISGTQTDHCGFTFATNQILPTTLGTANDNIVDLGSSSNRYNDAYITNGVTTGSDEREKQQIASLTDAEITAAKAISKLFKTYKWNSAVESKGDNARTHTGVIAQQIETAMSDAGLDAGDYAFFISTTWWEKDVEVAAVEADEESGIEAQDAYTRTDTYDTQEEAPEGATERTRLGLRYAELLAFIGAATEQRLTSIEARLDALEAG